MNSFKKELKKKTLPLFSTAISEYLRNPQNPSKVFAKVLVEDNEVFATNKCWCNRFQCSTLIGFLLFT